MLFLILTLETTITVDRSDDTLSTISSKMLQWWVLLLSELWLALWKKKWLEKVSTNLLLSWNSLLKE